MSLPDAYTVKLVKDSSRESGYLIQQTVNSDYFQI